MAIPDKMSERRLAQLAGIADVRMGVDPAVPGGDRTAIVGYEKSGRTVLIWEYTRWKAWYRKNVLEPAWERAIGMDMRTWNERLRSAQMAEIEREDMEALLITKKELLGLILFLGAGLGLLVTTILATVGVI